MSRQDDHYAWALTTAQALREGDLAVVDFSEVADELEQMGRADTFELASRITQILELLLKVEYSAGVLRDYNERGWRAAISRQQGELEILLQYSPSLKGKIDSQLIADGYRRAARTVRTEYPELRLPPECPFPVSKVLPGIRAGKKRKKP